MKRIARTLALIAVAPFVLAWGVVMMTLTSLWYTAQAIAKVWE